MNRIGLHNKTQVAEDGELPFNPLNRLLDEAGLRALFDQNGLEAVAFRNINLYRNAFVHRSYCTMKNDNFESGNERCPGDCLPLQDMSYERMEFLGDAVLGMVVARYLYDRYPDQNEGFLSKMRTKLVNGKMLGHLAGLIGLNKYVIISKQVEDIQGRDNYKILEDVFEALIAAICMDFQDMEGGGGGGAFAPLTGPGYHIAEAWIIAILENNLDFAELVSSKTNYKDALARLMQNNYQDAPRFFETSVDIQGGQKVFRYCVKDRAGVTLGTGRGPSKKDAENLAAEAALKYYGH